MLRVDNICKIVYNIVNVVLKIHAIYHLFPSVKLNRCPSAPRYMSVYICQSTWFNSSNPGIKLIKFQILNGL